MKSTNIHYAWVVLFGCTLMFFTIAGLSGNVYPVYSPFIMEQYGFSKTKISMISSLASLASTVSVLLTTSLYSKVSLRNGMLLAGLLNAAAFGLFGLADSFPVFLAASFLKGFSYGLGSLVPIAKIIENWFHTKRTLALSIVSAASGLATIGIPSLVTRIIQHYGIHISFYSNAVTFALIYLICWLLIRDDPSEMGLTAYEGAEKRKKTRETKEVKPLPSSWWNFLSVALLFATSAVSCFSNLSMLTSTEGFKPETVALVVSVSGASLMTGKLLFGVFSTAVGLKTSSLVFGFLGVVGLILCCLIRLSPVLLFIGTVLLGFDFSMIVVGSVAWVTDWAGPVDRAEHIKVFQSMYNMGLLVFGLLTGILADLFGGSYIPFYALSAVIAFCFACIIYLAYRKQEK